MGWSLRRIEEATKIRRETAAGYLKAAGIAIRKPGGWGKQPAPDAKPAIGMTTDSGPTINKTASACEPYRALIEEAVSRGRNAMAIWQDLVDQHGFTGAYESVKRFVRKQRYAHSPDACAVILTEPGEEA